MKFYDRETELQELHRLDDLSESVSQFTVLIGRRRTLPRHSDFRIFAQDHQADHHGQRQRLEGTGGQNAATDAEIRRKP